VTFTVNGRKSADVARQLAENDADYRRSTTLPPSEVMSTCASYSSPVAPSRTSGNWTAMTQIATQSSF